MDDGCGWSSCYSEDSELKNTDINVIRSSRSGEAERSKRIRLSTQFNHLEVEVSSSEEASPLGLKLSKTASFISRVERELSQAVCIGNCGNSNNSRMTDSFQSQPSVPMPAAAKMKASNAQALCLKIGVWERIAQHEGDLVVKFYYAKKKLVWEVLERKVVGVETKIETLKSKIEMKLFDISGIRATIPEDEPGILEVELKEPPLFFRESPPQPGKHTIWQPASDFTGGQVPIYRRHYVKFRPNTLGKHYEKLLQCDQHLLSLSKRPFPSFTSPYFYPNICQFSLSPQGYSPNFSTLHANSSSLFPHQISFSSFDAMVPNSPITGMQHLPGEASSSSFVVHENQRTALWHQGANKNAAMEDQIQPAGMMQIKPEFYPRQDHNVSYQMQTNMEFDPCQDHNVSYQTQTGLEFYPRRDLNVSYQMQTNPEFYPTQDHNVSDHIEQHLLNVKEKLLERSRPMNVDQLDHFGCLDNTSEPFSSNHFWPSQVNNEEPMIHLKRANSPYPSDFSGKNCNILN